MRCVTAIGTDGKPVWDAHEQDKWRDEYRLCGGVEIVAGADVTCPECGEVYESAKKENES